MVGRLLRSVSRTRCVVSAATGDGIEELLSAIDEELPDPTERIVVLLPFTRGDLVARAHEEGRAVDVDYTGGGRPG